MSSIEERVKKIVVEQLGVKEDEVTPNASFVDDLGADSLDTVELVMRRANGRGSADRIEMENVDFFERVRAAYRARAAAEPGRFRVVDAGRPLDQVLGDVRDNIDGFLRDCGVGG